ncbi:hypothetical protein AB0N64_12555 [Microbacterium sp. NPDC089318]
MSFDRPSTAPDDDRQIGGNDGADDPDARDEADDTGVLYEDQVEPEYGILGFTLREVIIIGAWLVGFVASFFPIGPSGDTVWTTGIHWILMMGVPTAAVFLIALRRLSPEGIRRVGSLGIDQFASVAASVAAVAWAQVLWQQVAATIATGAVLIGWVAIVGQLAMLALVAATVFAPFLPRLRDDFHGRMETLAHRNANPIRPVISRPRAERVASPANPVATSEQADAGEETADAAAEPRVETALTVVIPEGAAAAPDAGNPASGPDAGGHASRTDDVDDDQVLYNTAAVEALRDIFAVDETTNPRHPVEHNTAPDGLAGADVVEHNTAPDGVAGADAADRAGAAHDTTTAGDAEAEPLLRRSRTEQTSELTASEPTAEEPTGQEPTVQEPTGREPTAQEPTASGPAPTEPFWILAPTERDVLDEHGEPLFRVGPAAWALAIEDRGGAFVVRHEDGRIGYLHDISDITKG